MTPNALMSVIALAMLAASCATSPTDGNVAEEDYEFLSLTTGPCVPKVSIGIAPEYEAECKRMTEPRRYRGTWYVDFETSFFTPVGQPKCWGPKGQGACMELKGKALPWPMRWDCGREFEVDFIGRRNVLPTFFPSYTIVVDKLVSAKRLPDPDDPNCRPPTDAELRKDHPGIRGTCLEMARSFEELPDTCFDRPKGGTRHPSMS